MAEDAAGTMSTTPRRDSGPENEEGEAPHGAPQVIPSIGPGSPSFFPLQTVIEISQSLGQIKSDIAHLTKSVDSVKADVKDLVKWKSLILGGAAVIGIFASVAGYVSGKYTFSVTEKRFVAPEASRMVSPRDEPGVSVPTEQKVLTPSKSHFPDDR
jgi:hypothetical protein